MMHDHPLTLQGVLARMRRVNGAGRILTLRGDAVAEATYAQVALAWLIGKITAPIVSVTSLKQLADIVKAPQLKLMAEDMATLETAGNA